MNIPAKDAFGTRQTINAMLGQDEAVWHFRSGWNVAALNCTRAVHQPILDAYATMLRQEASVLTGVNTRVEAQFRASTGGSRRDALLARETHSTEMYNYFASPAARSQFCNTALVVANEYLATPPADFMGFAVTGLQRYELAFEQFYTAYEAYQVASADWDARYGAQYGRSQPGWVAIYGNRTQQQAAGVTATGLVPSDPVSVPDAGTGATIPVIPIDDTATGTPVVQPLAGEGVTVPPPAENDDGAQ